MLGENSVPLGVAGTGAAYILPDSQSIKQFNPILDYGAKQQAAAEALSQKQAADLSAAWQKNQLNIKGGTLYQPEINDRTAKVMALGLDLQKAGVNPNSISNDPQTQALLESYQTKKAALLRDVDTRDKISQRATDYEKQLSQQPAGYFDPQSVQDYHDYISGKIPLSEINSKGLQMPELKKTFDLQPLLDKIPGVSVETTGTNPMTGVRTSMVLPNETAHTKLANGLVNNNPEIQADIAKKAGLPFSQIGNQTDPEVIKKQVDDFWRSTPNIPKLAQIGITSYSDPKYDDFISTQATQMARAAKVKADYINNIKGTLDAKVHARDDKSWDFAYQNAQMARERLGMERQRFDKWKEDQQNEAGTFTLGNQHSFVPVIKTRTSLATGEQGNSTVEPEAGASLYGVNLPGVKAVVRPSVVTDIKTGKTYKNTSPIDVSVSQIQMVPVFKDIPGDDNRNGSEVSARQLKEIVEGKHKQFTMKNITFQPFAYGIKSQHDDNNIHTVNTPIKFSYDALKGSNVKKINTTTFDQATDGLRSLQSNPKFKALSPEDQLQFISQKYNVKID